MKAENAPEVVERLRAAGDPLSIEAADVIDGLRSLIDPEFTFRDLEAHIRDGSFELNVVGGQEGGDPVYRLLCAVLLNVLLGPDEEEPPNYRAVEWSIKPAGEFERWRLCGEVIKPGGKSSHEIRKELEARLNV